MQAFGRCCVFDASCEAAAAAAAAPPDDTPHPPAAHSTNGGATIRPEFDPARRMSTDGHGATDAASVFIFAVRDGRLGSIALTDAGANKRTVAQPRWAVQFHESLTALVMAATEALVFIGDSKGTVFQWNTDTGETNVVPTAQKPLRWIALTPAGAQTSASGGAPQHGGRRGHAAVGRLVLQYDDGALAVRPRFRVLLACRTAGTAPCCGCATASCWHTMRRACSCPARMPCSPQLHFLLAHEGSNNY